MVVGAYADHKRKEGKVSKQTIDIICAALLAIVSALRKEAGLPNRNNITVIFTDNDTLAGIAGYNQAVTTGKDLVP